MVRTMTVRSCCSTSLVALLALSALLALALTASEVSAACSAAEMAKTEEVLAALSGGDAELARCGPRELSTEMCYRSPQVLLRPAGASGYLSPTDMNAACCTAHRSGCLQVLQRNFTVSNATELPPSLRDVGDELRVLRLATAMPALARVTADALPPKLSVLHLVDLPALEELDLDFSALDGGAWRDLRCDLEVCGAGGFNFGATNIRLEYAGLPNPVNNDVLHNVTLRNALIDSFEVDFVRGNDIHVTIERVNITRFLGLFNSAERAHFLIGFFDGRMLLSKLRVADVSFEQAGSGFAGGASGFWFKHPEATTGSLVLSYLGLSSDALELGNVVLPAQAMRIDQLDVTNDGELPISLLAKTESCGGVASRERCTELASRELDLFGYVDLSGNRLTELPDVIGAKLTAAAADAGRSSSTPRIDHARYVDLSENAFAGKVKVRNEATMRGVRELWLDRVEELESVQLPNVPKLARLGMRNCPALGTGQGSGGAWLQLRGAAPQLVALHVSDNPRLDTIDTSMLPPQLRHLGVSRTPLAGRFSLAGAPKTMQSFAASGCTLSALVDVPTRTANLVLDGNQLVTVTPEMLGAVDVGGDDVELDDNNSTTSTSSIPSNPNLRILNVRNNTLRWFPLVLPELAPNLEKLYIASQRRAPANATAATDGDWVWGTGQSLGVLRTSHLMSLQLSGDDFTRVFIQRSHKLNVTSDQTRRELWHAALAPSVLDFSSQSSLKSTIVGQLPDALSVDERTELDEAHGLPSDMSAIASSLQSLSFANQQLEGTLPNALFRLTALRSLSLQNNALNFELGAIESQLRQLRSLEHLDLSANLAVRARALNGDGVHSSFVLDTLPSLRTCNLRGLSIACVCPSAIDSRCTIDESVRLCPSCGGPAESGAVRVAPQQRTTTFVALATTLVLVVSSLALAAL